MNSLVYLLKRTLINTLKGLIKKPAALIAYIVIAGFFITTSILSGQNGDVTNKSLDMDTVKSILVGYTTFLLIMTLISSLSKGASFFRMADVNFLFTSPVKAGSILVYGFIKQLGVNLLVMAFLGLQYPNWKRMFGFRDGAGIILIMTYILLVIVTSVLGMLLYSYISRKPERRKQINNLIYVCVIGFLLPIVLQAFKTGDLGKSAIDYLANDNIKYIPIIGWFRELLLGAFVGITPTFMINAGIVLAVSIIIFIYLYKMDTDFFEDVLSNTETKETLVKAMRTGKAGSAYVSNRKYKKIKFSFTMVGSKAIFQKQLLEQRKSGVWIVSWKTFMLLAGALIATFTVKVKSEELISIFLGASVYIMLIFTMAGAWSGELSKHYIYLIPGSAFSKMIYSTITEVIKSFVEGIIVLGIPGIIIGCPIMTLVMAILIYTSMGMVFVYSDLFLRRAFGKIHSNALRIFFRIFLVMFGLVPVAVSVAIIIAMTKSFALAFSVGTGVNLVLVLIFMLVGMGLFNNPELD